MKIFFLTILVAVLYTLGDTASTKYFEYTDSPRWWLLVGVVLNSLGVIVFGYVASSQGVGVSLGMMLALNIILNTALGIYLFKD